MSTQHRPGREIPPKPHRPATLLERFYTSIESGNVAKATQLLEQIERKPPAGLWPHRALGLVFKAPHAQQLPLLELLLAGKHPPQPTSNSDFIRLAVDAYCPQLLHRLLEAGFRGRPRTVGLLLHRLHYRKDIDTDRLLPVHLMGASAWDLAAACAQAVVSNASVQWMRTLNAALPTPRPTRNITDMVMDAMVRLGDGMSSVSRHSLNLARDLWWVDFNMAQALHQDKWHERTYAGRPRHAENQMALHAQALSMIERSGMEEEMAHSPTPVAVASPRKRL